MNILDEYVNYFGKKPPKLMIVSYDDEIYQKLMKDALDRGVALDDDDVLEAFKNYKFDVVNKR